MHTFKEVMQSPVKNYPNRLEETITKEQCSGIVIVPINQSEKNLIIQEAMGKVLRKVLPQVGIISSRLRPIHKLPSCH